MKKILCVVTAVMIVLAPQLAKANDPLSPEGLQSMGQNPTHKIWYSSTMPGGCNPFCGVMVTKVPLFPKTPAYASLHKIKVLPTKAVKPPKPRFPRVHLQVPGQPLCHSIYLLHHGYKNNAMWVCHKGMINVPQQ